MVSPSAMSLAARAAALLLLAGGGHAGEVTSDTVGNDGHAFYPVVGRGNETSHFVRDQPLVGDIITGVRGQAGDFAADMARGMLGAHGYWSAALGRREKSAKEEAPLGEAAEAAGDFLKAHYAYRPASEVIAKEAVEAAVVYWLMRHAEMHLDAHGEEYARKLRELLSALLSREGELLDEILRHEHVHAKPARRLRIGQIAAVVLAAALGYAYATAATGRRPSPSRAAEAWSEVTVAPVAATPSFAGPIVEDNHATGGCDSGASSSRTTCSGCVTPVDISRQPSGFPSTLAQVTAVDISRQPSGFPSPLAQVKCNTPSTTASRQPSGCADPIFSPGCAGSNVIAEARSLGPRARSSQDILKAVRTATPRRQEVSPFLGNHIVGAWATAPQTVGL